MNENFDITYKALFRRYYPSLIFYATRLVGEEEAEDVVQDVFVELWKRKDHIEIGDQIQAFLYRAVYTRALNVLKHRSVEEGYCVAMEEINQRRAEFYQPDNNEVIRRIEDKELRKEIHDAINELPDNLHASWLPPSPFMRRGRTRPGSTPCGLKSITNQ